MFELLATDRGSKARRGRLTTVHGVIETPAFMPVGTQGSVKAVSPRASDEERDKGLSAGFDCYLTKPIDFHELRQVLGTPSTAPRRAVARIWPRLLECGVFELLKASCTKFDRRSSSGIAITCSSAQAWKRCDDSAGYTDL